MDQGSIISSVKENHSKLADNDVYKILKTYKGKLELILQSFNSILYDTKETDEYIFSEKN